MRGTVAKQLRRFAENDTEVWEKYGYRRTSHHSSNQTCVLYPDCGKKLYRTIKKIWKVTS